MKQKYDIDMYLVAMDLMAEMKLLTDLDIWIDGGLKCPVCSAKSTDIQYIGKATENG